MSDETTEPAPLVITGTSLHAHLDDGSVISGSTGVNVAAAAHVDVYGGPLWAVSLSPDALAVAPLTEDGQQGDWLPVDLPEQWTGDHTIARVVTYDDGSEHLAVDIARAGVLLHADLGQIEAGVTEWREVWI